MRAVIMSMAAAGTLALAGNAMAQAPRPEATVDRAVAAYGKVKTLRASFRQELTNPLLNRTMVARGEMMQRIPGQLAIRFTDPAGDRIVQDGQHVWVYLPSTNPDQVIKMRADRNSAGMHDVTAMFLEQPHERYTITDAGAATIEGRATRAVHLVPKDRNFPFRRATVWVDDRDGLIRQFEVTEQSGMVRKVTIQSIAVNGPLPRTAFTFVPPRGARVIDQTNSASR